MFNKEQRFVLGKLSDSIWNATSKWQKLYNAGHFDVVESEIEVEEDVTQLCVANSKRTRGTIFNKVTALNKGVWGDTPEKTKVKRRVMRKPTYDELIKSLTEISKAVVYSKMTNSELVNALAIDFVHKDEAVNVKLAKKQPAEGVSVEIPEIANYQKDYDELFSKLPEDLQTKVKELEAKEQGIPLDALEFVSEVLFAKTHPESSLDVFNGNVEAAVNRHKRMMRQQDFKARTGL